MAEQRVSSSALTTGMLGALDFKERNMKTLLITGVSSGFGQALAQQALKAGHKVLGTVRSQAALDSFAALAPGRAHGALLDVTDFARIPALVAELEARHGAIDVLVNNAGYGHEGIFEEASLEQMRHQFDVNLWGAVAMMKALVPRFRARRAGHIINITSMGGFITMPGISDYCASKFALEAFSETLSQELAGFNIAVTAVAPGSFRTDWAGRSMVRSERAIADYDALFDPVRQARQQKSGKQLGAPQKAAEAILALISHPKPPAHLLLGSDALALVQQKLASLGASFEEWQALTRSTDG
ncbi:short-subunit dehydrogenase [Gallaecimonas pentaromativorans]|uniref:Short-subunit dehydrogenase n=2 Tax=Gallaecimonas pentaromativorans TaxID=584787 RepID=A0A3N1PPM3_9GAMM|nr:short-subunit dehydrogenase [Gallaecimonas pentaromativorans]